MAVLPFQQIRSVCSRSCGHSLFACAAGEDLRRGAPDEARGGLPARCPRAGGPTSGPFGAATERCARLHPLGFTMVTTSRSVYDVARRDNAQEAMRVTGEARIAQEDRLPQEWRKSAYERWLEAEGI